MARVCNSPTDNSFKAVVAVTSNKSSSGLVAWVNYDFTSLYIIIIKSFKPNVRNTENERCMCSQCSKMNEDYQPFVIKYTSFTHKFQLYFETIKK